MKQIGRSGVKKHFMCVFVLLYLDKLSSKIVIESTQRLVMKEESGMKTK